MKAKDWFLVLGVSSAMLVTIFLVAYGGWWLLVDTGRAILHP